MRLEPITWERLTEALADRLLKTEPHDGGARLRVGFDGAPAAGTGRPAAALAEALRLRGRPSVVVDTADFLRPASLRYEYGREDPDAYYGGWYDTGALWREVFGPLDPGGSGLVLPDLWDPGADRATRSERVALPPGGVLLLHGPFLLGQWFPFDLTVHLDLSPAALHRLTPAADRWALPAFERYAAETDPRAAADTVVRADRPGHPAWSGLPA
ncbi:uridine kinase [Streptomyces tremellae]|uniref:Uridine kinase n=1 Tax=Streptomyces tremellae TaxID=1124239 RepID=A0ABP7FMN7_9ACTN